MRWQSLAALAARHLTPAGRRRRRALAAFRAGLVALRSSPFDLADYDRLISETLARGIRIARFDEEPTGRRGAVVQLRHDIDLPRCPPMLPRFAEIERRHGVRSGVFLLAGPHAPYELADLRGLAADLRADGFQVGLHTLCYVADDPWAEFEAERERFRQALGFEPQSFNAHGLGRVKLRERRRFYAQVDRRRLSALGFGYSDLAPHLRRYDHVVEDCHRRTSGEGARDVAGPGGTDDGARCIMSDFRGVPDLPDARYLVLTHPGYWA